VGEPSGEVPCQDVEEGSAGGETKSARLFNGGWGVEGGEGAGRGGVTPRGGGPVFFWGRRTAESIAKGAAWKFAWATGGSIWRGDLSGPEKLQKLQTIGQQGNVGEGNR